ncbi:MAG: aspartyl/glutamyl-tRNA amidotransferase subunit A, partial [Clostridia bacterium]|nr:aspartyl/glutamyl-tRNA amidotransferase subunit A [Clostridia bacterium]
QGIRTTCASRMLENYIPPYSAAAWERLEGAGCVLLGKTNMDEFGMGSSTENSAFHPTLNPHDLQRVPGGSSGGSAAAVAAGEAAFCLGSDTGGSLRQPAAFCRLVGMKPTYGTVSRWGLVAFASSLDQIGPMTRTCRDNARVLDAIAGHDRRDSTSLSREFAPFGERIGQPVKGLKVAVWGDMRLPPLPGVTFVEAALPALEQALPAYYVLSSCEASSNLARYDGIRYGLRGQGDDLEEMYVSARSQGFGPEVKRRILLGTFCLSAGHYDRYYHKALQARERIRQNFQRLFEGCDALISPVSPQGPWRLGEKRAPLAVYQEDLYTVPASLAGLPALAVGNVQLLGPAHAEALLYQLGHALEEVGPW